MFVAEDLRVPDMGHVFAGCALIGAALLMGSIAAAQKPDLHAGGAQPSLIENHKTTKVVLPGYHMASATLTVDGACSLVSYEAAENQVVMELAANRAVTDRDGYCNLHVKNAAGSASTWVEVGLTEQEQADQNSTDRSVEREKSAQFMARSGSQWTLHFAEGGKTTYKLKPGTGEPGVTIFADDAGNEVKIMVANDATVLIVPSGGGCYRTGKLVGGRVTNGTSGGECRPDGNWTAEMR
ncbi:MAG TPA: hypothetical protein VN734_07010 [Acidobacteriaceae bacterium]|nr:hypothetical protein [Acidobacteriaceae bacterium]